MTDLVDYLGLTATAPPTPAVGDMIRRGIAGGFEVFGPGNANQVLAMDPVTLVPVWKSVSSLDFSVNVKDAAYGAKGDGVTDDTAAIQLAINAVVGAGGGSLLFPLGIYPTTGVYAQDAKSINFVGVGRSASVIKVTGGPGNTALNCFSNLGTGGISNVGIRDLQITYAGSGNTALLLRNVDSLTVERSIFYSDKLATSIQGSFNGVFSDVQIYLIGSRLDPIAALWVGSGKPAPHAGTTVLSATLSTGSPITSLPVKALTAPIAGGTSVVLNYAGVQTQTWVLSADAATGATSLAVSSQSPNYAYPAGTAVIGPSTTTTSGAGAIDFRGCIIQSYNGVPAAIIEDNTLPLRFQTNSWLGRDSQSGGVTGLQGVVTVDGPTTSVTFADNYNEQSGSSAPSGALYSIGVAQGTCGYVKVAGDQSTGANSVGVSSLPYWMDVQDCKYLNARHVNAIVYNNGVVRLRTGYPAAAALANDTRQLYLDMVDNGVTTGSPIYVDDNGVIPSTYRGSVSRSKTKSFGPGPLGVRVKKVSTFSLSSATPAAVPFAAEDFKDAANAHSNSSNTTRLVCQVGGRYRVYATVVFDASATGARAIMFLVNGVTYIGGQNVGADTTATVPTALSAFTEWNFSVGDYVECQAVQQSGGALNVLVSSAYDGIPTHFGMEIVGG